ncbi:uncharacterized protein LOC143035286 [Oratosquilla oratoria]|uniref:uncharacterized protein LOC143035286 n=1 Tax=Oratosquilla oratoria TaxID=337810 RepID=UPI003F764BCF
MVASADLPPDIVTREHYTNDSVFAPSRGDPQRPVTHPTTLYTLSTHSPSINSPSSSTPSSAYTSAGWKRRSSRHLLSSFLPSSLSPPEAPIYPTSLEPASLPSSSPSTSLVSSSLPPISSSSTSFLSSNISQLFSSPSSPPQFSSSMTPLVSPDPLFSSISSSSSDALESSISETPVANHTPLTSHRPPLYISFTRSTSPFLSSTSSSFLSTSTKLPSTFTPEMARTTSQDDSSHVPFDLINVASAQVTHSEVDLNNPSATLPSNFLQPSQSYNDSLPFQTLESVSEVISTSTITSSFTSSLNPASSLEPHLPTHEGPHPSPSEETSFEVSSPEASWTSADLFLLDGLPSSNSLDLDYPDHNYTQGMCQGSTNSFTTNTTSATNSSDDYNYDYCDSYYIFFWEELGPLLVVYGLTFLVGVVGNLLIIVVVRRNPRLHNATNMFLTSLATADLLFLLLSVPVKVAKLFSYTWNFGPVLCKLVHYVQNILVICSVLTLAAISVERYYGIVHPMKAVYKCTMSQARKVIAIVWIASFFLASPIIVVQMHLEVGEAVRAYWCVRSWDWVWAWRLHETYLLLLVVCAPSILMGAAYYKVCREVVKTYAAHQLETGIWQKEQVEGLSRVDVQAVSKTGRFRKDAATRTQVVRMLIVVVLMFVACWSPVMIIHVLQAWDFLPLYSTVVKHLKTFADFLTYANSCINPLVYGFMSRNFRDAFRFAMFCGRRRRKRRTSLLRQCRWGESSSTRRTKTKDDVDESRVASSVPRKEEGKTKRRMGPRRTLGPRTNMFSFRSSSTWFSPSASPNRSFENDSVRDSPCGASLFFGSPSVTKIGNIRLQFPTDCTVTLTVTQPDQHHHHKNNLSSHCHSKCLQQLDAFQLPQVCQHHQHCLNRDCHLTSPCHHICRISKSIETLKASSEYN